MLIKFFGSGVGSGGPPTDYVCNEMVPTVATVTGKDGKLHSKILRDAMGKPVMKTRNPPPEVLAGDPRQTKTLIDSLDFRWRYTSGVIAYAPDDTPSDEDIREIMEDFENLAFAGLERDRTNILWVRHVHEGTTELHFIVPRVDLLTGKSLNIAPPGWEKFFDPLRDYWNYRKSWARPDDLARARLHQPGHVAFQQAEHLRAGLPRIDDPKEAITEYLVSRIEAGLVIDREGIIDALKEVVHEITRQGNDYISVRLEPDAKPIRLRGIIYGKSFKPESVFGAGQGENGGGKAGTRTTDEDRARDARRRFEEGIRRRADYNRHRYQARVLDPVLGDRGDASGTAEAIGRDSAPSMDNLDRSGDGRVESLPGYFARKLGPDAIPGGGDHPAATGSGGPGGEGGQVHGDRLWRDPEALREDRTQGTGVPGGLSDFERLLNLEVSNDGIRDPINPGINAAVRAIRKGHEAARRSSQGISGASADLDRAIAKVGMIDGVNHGNQNKFK